MMYDCTCKSHDDGCQWLAHVPAKPMITLILCKKCGGIRVEPLEAVTELTSIDYRLGHALVTLLNTIVSVNREALAQKKANHRDFIYTFTLAIIMLIIVTILPW